METVEFGFIGTGNMGAALARAVRRTCKGEDMILSNRTQKKAQLLANELKCSAGDNNMIAASAKYIFLGVKPQMMSQVLSRIAPQLARRTDRFVLITMAAGLSIASINEMLGATYPVIRIMPNTPVAIGEGMVVYSTNDEVYMDELTDFCNAMKAVGKLDKIDENLIDAASAISGCGPAFVYMFAEALADAGVECGLPRAKAIEYAAQTLSGAAKLISYTGKHPGQLKDEVCSPGGTTIAGVHALENAGFRAAAMNAVEAAYNKTLSLKK